MRHFDRVTLYSIPEPCSNIGSVEVARITTLLQNRIVKDSLRSVLFTAGNCSNILMRDWELLKEHATVSEKGLKDIFEKAYRSRRFLPDDATMLGLLSADIMLDIVIGKKYDCMLKLRCIHSIISLCLIVFT